MELWQAILLGSQIRGKADGLFYSPRGKTSCALGAAVEAQVGTEIFTSPMFWPGRELGRQWPWINETITACPECDKKKSVDALIAHLNNTDGHDWTRERIALEFVKPLEESLKPIEVALAAVGVEA